MSARTTERWDVMPLTVRMRRLRSLFTMAPNSQSRSCLGSLRQASTLFVVSVSCTGPAGSQTPLNHCLPVQHKQSKA
ncbi:hypothetical protein E2C01_073038 [Portunus trituberculatus]|uniref:Uncharacterized protein n=1 Tax=Portunus trituberculatus TaxID=210409 RepID=A0A5B7I1R0_PORTR|nr:hypothetical protein [Portunus trituberculatus]